MKKFYITGVSGVGKSSVAKKLKESWYKDFNKDMLNKGAISINTDKSLEDVVEEVMSKFSK